MFARDHQLREQVEESNRDKRNTVLQGTYILNWDDVRVFLAIAEEGSFRKAAIKTNTGYSTLSRRIENLERSIGSRLFMRQSTGLLLTEAGHEMLRTAGPMRDEFDGLQSRLFGQEKVPSGTIRLTIPNLLLTHFLIDHLKAFMAEWPEIHLDIECSLSVLNLSAREADLAVRLTRQPPDNLVGREVASFCEAVYASKDYLETFAKQAHATTRPVHQWIYPGGGYEFEGQINAPFTGEPVAAITLPEVDAQLRAAKHGIGIATLPCVMADPHNSLVRISEPYERSSVWLLTHPDTRGNKRMQVFREFLVEVFVNGANLLAGRSV